jgi:hypothetical protein
MSMTLKVLSLDAYALAETQEAWVNSSMEEAALAGLESVVVRM